MSMKKIKVKLTFTEEILGTANATATIHDEYIASKAPDAKSREEEIAALGVAEVENEPAPAATGTSSEVSKDTDNIHIDDSVKTQICQEAQKAYKACELILDIYERMEDEEQKAFDMGQSYRAMLEVKEELTRIGNGGDNNG